MLLCEHDSASGAAASVAESDTVFILRPRKGSRVEASCKVWFDCMVDEVRNEVEVTRKATTGVGPMPRAKHRSSHRFLPMGVCIIEETVRSMTRIRRTWTAIHVLMCSNSFAKALFCAIFESIGCTGQEESPLLCAIHLAVVSR